MLEYLQGKKTYIVAVVGVIVNGLYIMGYIEESAVKTIDGLLLFLGLGTLRAGMNK
jgi:type IV secretory pathway VirB2 component (pilin)